MNIRVIAVGKLKERYQSEGVKDYLRRLKPYAKVGIVEVAEEPLGKSASPAEEALARRREAGRILDHIKPHSYCIALDREGVALSSEEFSAALEKVMLSGTSDIAFVIGGSTGLAPEVINRADMRLSFSRMTFPHGLMRVILLEQVYRAFKILRGETYHK
ncbi:MAG TPA: 23S rRNA (pseudouridine(1915)-N(3))-methyltransferase RlmH [Firmicutes bacterium]|nr:23S rRNA (pseudouridine(1915)-N(3))-methyltransferase RlmH [Bacillota bacterium]